MAIRRRLVFWLIREYLRRWGKRILFFFVLGLLTFIVLITTSNFFISKIPFGKKENEGISGAYTLNNLPPTILSNISMGLTTVASDGSIKPGLAKSWEIKDDGKTFIFKLNTNLNFSDGTQVTSSSISYNFSDVKIERPDKETLVFKLKDAYAPFLVTVSAPVFKKGFIGVGKFKINNIKLNGDFVKSITLSSIKNKFDLLSYQFYPTTDSLKTAYSLGEISTAVELPDLDYKETNMGSFANTIVKKNVDYSRLITLFYNNQDKYLSDKKLRNALSYALPNLSSYGEESISFYPPSSWAFKEGMEKRGQDMPHAKLLAEASLGENSKNYPVLEIKVLPKYNKIAQKISKEWGKIGIKTKISETNSLPAKFQIFLGDFNISQDPDQYTLWHSGQDNNITNYKNLRIDKLLEDGRKTIDIKERKKLYYDLQKYLIDDQPASFLFFPFDFEITRK